MKQFPKVRSFPQGDLILLLIIITLHCWQIIAQCRQKHQPACGSVATEGRWLQIYSDKKQSSKKGETKRLISPQSVLIKYQQVERQNKFDSAVQNHYSYKDDSYECFLICYLCG